MGYAVHIRRASGDISRAEWIEAARADKGLKEDGTETISDGSEVPRFVWKDAVFVWDEGEVTVEDLDDEWCTRLGEVAAMLGAEAVGDDGERYLADGRVDYGEGAQTLHRIADVAAAVRRPTEPRTGARRAGKRPLVIAAVVVVLVLAAIAASFAHF